MWAVSVAAVATALPCHALYKVVGPDGKVTYTDTPPPAAAGGKVTTMRATDNATASVALPIELRQAVQRYPVTLYTLPVCETCDRARLLLRERGVPFSEKLVVSNADGDELLRLTGAREAPTLAIGSQLLRGLSQDTWHSYLDAAGYPRESRLPANYRYPAATPLTEPAAPPPAPAPAARRPAAPPTQEPAAPPPSPTGIRF
jgi:glutaredoxin